MNPLGNFAVQHPFSTRLLRGRYGGFDRFGFAPLERNIFTDPCSTNMSLLAERRKFYLLDLIDPSAKKKKGVSKKLTPSVWAKFDELETRRGGS